MTPTKPAAKFAKSRAADDSVWLHDRAPGGPRSAADPNAPPSNKLMVSNLHYEITPKDLTAIFGKMGTLVREPFIRYDRSGRSSGVAIITFETPPEAKQAKGQLDGVLAKGQPISIQFDQSAPRRASAPASSLLSRIQKPPLLNRLDRAHSDAKASLMHSKKLGPIRGRGRGSGAGRSRAVNAPPKSAADLDNEIDAFMAVDSTSGTPAAKSAENGDVEMA